MLWVLLAIATLLQGESTANAIFMPFEGPSIYLKSIEKVMTNEMVMFLQFLFIFVLIFWISMCVHIWGNRSETGRRPPYELAYELGINELTIISTSMHNNYPTNRTPPLARSIAAALAKKFPWP